MRFDVEGELGSVLRSVASLEREGQGARSVTLSRRFEGTPEDLWDAATNADRIPRWFLPVTGDLRQGGRYQLEGNAGGTVTECRPLSRFAMTWEFAGDVSWVEVTCSEEGPGLTRLSLTHTSLLSGHWAHYGPGAVGVGWELALLGLALHIARPGDPKPDEAAFVASPDGRAIIEGSSEAWARAAIDNGAAPGEAHAAAARTTAFYTGEPEPDA